MSILTDPAVMAALNAVATDQASLTNDAATQASASANLVAAQTAKSNADGAVATDTTNLNTHVQGVYAAIQASTGIAPAPAAPPPLPATASPAAPHS